MVSTWPENCPQCGAEWKIKSKTMGAARGQPHQGRCTNGHWWHETTSSTSHETASLLSGILGRLEQQPQRQDSLNDQLSDLAHVANRLGMYDAADYIARQLSTPTPERTS